MLTLVLLVLYVVLMISVGLISMKKTSMLQDFCLGGRRMGPWVSAFSYGTAYFSDVYF